MKTPKIYLVGGAVRDQLLGNVPKDLDYVVVGATLDWMLSQGFKQVGASFPVFLHPETGDEYAMARRERKTGVGYQAFEFEFGPDVTLVEDLSRRDLTMNSIAFDLEEQAYVDPYGGVSDLTDKVIRHTSDAFSEDPLRVMRVARFAARYGFEVSFETAELCRKLVNSGELDALSADRIWGELEKLMSEARPSVGLQFLAKIGALHEVKRLMGLVLNPPIHYDWIYKYDIEPRLTLGEKNFFNLRVQDLSKAQIEAFRVPTPVVREVKFYRDIYDLMMYSHSPQSIVHVFDGHREELKNGDIMKVVDLIIKCVQVPTHELALLSKIDRSFRELLKLDFTELVKGIKPSEIKDFVRTAKLNVVKSVMEKRDETI
jgi:tRNA nucleotidyltransferase (CCA-adding enzyme)